MKEVSISLVAFSLGTKRSQLPLTLQCVCMYVCTTDTLVYTQPLLGTRECYENFGDFFTLQRKCYITDLLLGLAYSCWELGSSFNVSRVKACLLGKETAANNSGVKRLRPETPWGALVGGMKGVGVVGTVEGRHTHTWSFISTSEEHKSHWMNSATQLQVAYGSETQMYMWTH